MLCYKKYAKVRFFSRITSKFQVCYWEIHTWTDSHKGCRAHITLVPDWYWLAMGSPHRRAVNHGCRQRNLSLPPEWFSIVEASAQLRLDDSAFTARQQLDDGFLRHFESGDSRRSARHSFRKTRVSALSVRRKRVNGEFTTNRQPFTSLPPGQCRMLLRCK